MRQASVGSDPSASTAFPVDVQSHASTIRALRACRHHGCRPATGHPRRSAGPPAGPGRPGQAGNHLSGAGLHRPHGRRPADHRQGEGLLRQGGHDRRGAQKANLLGRHPRQPGAGQRWRWHRWGPHPQPDALPAHHGGDQQEQETGADEYSGAAEYPGAGNFGIQGIPARQVQSQVTGIGGGGSQEKCHR